MFGSQIQNDSNPFIVMCSVIAFHFVVKSAGFVPTNAPDLIVAPWPRAESLPAPSAEGDAARAAMDAVQAMLATLTVTR